MVAQQRSKISALANFDHLDGTDGALSEGEEPSCDPMDTKLGHEHYGSSGITEKSRVLQGNWHLNREVSE